jgi:hypothetical protein
MRSLALALVLSAPGLVAAPSTADAAVPEYDSAYAGESAFISTGPGQTGQFQVFFINTGSATWRKGTATQVNLVVCLANKTTCNVESINAAWNDGSWLSDRAYATQTQAEVTSTGIASFVYTFKAPLTITNGIWRFNGDLALAATGQMIHQEGYYQEAMCSCDRP